MARLSKKKLKEIIKLITVEEPDSSDRTALPYFVLQEIVQRQIGVFRQDRAEPAKITPASCSSAGKSVRTRTSRGLDCLNALIPLGFIQKFQSKSGIKFTKYTQMYILSEPALETVKEFFEKKDLPKVMKQVIQKVLAQQCFERGTNLLSFTNFYTSASNYLKVEFQTTQIGIIINLFNEKAPSKKVSSEKSSSKKPSRRVSKKKSGPISVESLQLINNIKTDLFQQEWPERNMDCYYKFAEYLIRIESLGIDISQQEGFKSGDFSKIGADFGRRNLNWSKLLFCVTVLKNKKK